jgi:asparagine synthase (glutamine-hydrolysing)
LFLLSKLVRECGYKVVVTGEGADEVIAGYDIFREARVRQFWARDPGSPRRSRAAELLYPWMVRSPGQAPAFARTFFGRNLDLADPAMSHRPRWDATGVLRSMLSRQTAARLPGPDVVADAVISRMPSESAGWDLLSRAQWLEMTTLLAGYILASQGDRMLMANSVEGRFPFLDREVVALCNAMPPRHKLFGLDEKHVLKAAFADLVPQEILRRDKQPYRAPDAASFFVDGEMVPYVAELTCAAAVDSAGLFNTNAVRMLFQKGARSGGVGMSNTDNMRVLAVVSTQLLHQQFVDGGASSTDGQPPQPMLVVDLTVDEWQEV